MNLIINEAAKIEILRVKKYAEENKIDRNRLMQMFASLEGPVGDLSGHGCIIEDGFKIVYSIESQPVGWCRHLSVSVNGNNKLPSVPAVELLMQEFGFVGGIHDCENVWMEKDVVTASGKKGTAINILQVIE